MAFIRSKRSGNYLYLYYEERIYVPGKKSPKSVSRCLGRADGGGRQSQEPSNEFDRFVAGHSSEFEDMQQGAVQAAPEATTQSQPDFLGETAAPSSTESTQDTANSESTPDADTGTGEGET